MTALAAAFHRDGRSMAPPKFALVAAALQPFGTARAAPWCEGPAGLAWVAGAHFVHEDALDTQPVAAGAYIVLFDGLLADRPGLVDALGLEPRRAAQQADSALFAQAWERWGESAALRVEGEFAAVVWDARARVLSAVCSPLEAPPLYYAVDRRRAILATAPRAIFAWGDLPRRVDDAVLASHMINDPGDGRATCYEGVSSLLPGEVLTVSPKTARVRQYYDLAERAPPVRLAADADYVEAAGALLRDAVESSMRAPETPAIALSGGVDSSALAVAVLDSLAAGGEPGPLVSITNVPPSGSGDRRDRLGDEVRKRVLSLAAMHPGLDARFYDGDDIDLEQSLQQFVELVELPMRAAWQGQAPRAFARAAAEAGRNVVLTGDGGNNTLSYDGLALLSSLLRAGRLPSLLRESAGGEPGRRLGGFSPLLHYALYPNLSRRLHGQLRRLIDGRQGWPDNSAIHPGFARTHRVDERAREAGFDPMGRRHPSPRKVLLNRWENARLRHWRRAVRWAAEAAFGVQVRTPLTHRRLVEWCAGLPDEQFLRGGQSRRLIRRLMEGRLPPEVWGERLQMQASDLHPRDRDLAAIRATLMRWRTDPNVAERLDLERLLRLLDAGQMLPARRRNLSDRMFIRYGLDHALAVGRFIRWTEGGGNWAQA